MTMPDWQERVIIERHQLNEKVTKLGTFLDSAVVRGIVPHDLALLRVQHNAMSTYLAVLDERIALFDGITEG